MRNKSHIEKLNELGLWNGPKNYLIKKLLRADQIIRNAGFMGVFEKGAFNGVYKELEDQTNVYLGKPGTFWQLEIDRDKVRDPKTGKLHIVKTEEHKTPEYYMAHKEIPKTELPKRGARAVPVHVSDEHLVVHPLDHSLQALIQEPSSFEGCHIQINGMPPVGAEIACQLTKMGLTRLSVYDPGLVKSTDTSASRYRVFGPNRTRLMEAGEIIADGSLCQVIESYPKYIDGAEEFGNIVVNAETDPVIRKQIWALVKANAAKINLYVDALAAGEKGRVFAFKPTDAAAIEIYETDLNTAPAINPAVCGEIIYTTGFVGSWATRVISRYVRAAGPMKDMVIDKLFYVDEESITTDSIPKIGEM